MIPKVDMYDEGKPLDRHHPKGQRPDTIPAQGIALG
jgi:hypothetical protein